MTVIVWQYVGLVLFSTGCMQAVIRTMGPCEIHNEESAICSGRNLTSVPKDLPTNLTILDLSYNSVDATDLRNSRRLQALRNLVFLNLSNNHIPTLSPGIFASLKMLKVLDLSNCEIDVLHPRAFKGLLSLKTLILNNNRIKDLAPQSLSDMQALSTLDLANNKLSIVSIQLLEKFEGIHEVRLQENSWVCDCTLYPLQKWLKLQLDLKEEIRCMFPSELQGMNLLNLDLSPVVCSEKTKRFPRQVDFGTSAFTVTAVTNQTSGAPSKEGSKGWHYLVAVLVIAVAFSILIAVGAKFKLFHKYLSSYSHQLLPENDASSQDAVSVIMPRSSEMEDISDRTMYPDLEEDDGYIEDNYIQTEVKAEDEQEIHVSI
ncbi:type III endosome membrane protein TEMP isoform X1 [Scyliorhinus torazame]|uniref:type III endosome membrane protein TEMP isoform X1 n=1 Tax=Scyliorhinus torazame TaxID=75743 RepID=UPI003B58F49D